MTSRRSISITAGLLVVFAAFVVAVLAIRASSKEGFSFPEGVTLATPAPDLSQAVSPDVAARQLEADPELEPLVSAIAAGSIDGLLDLIDWELKTCTVAGGKGDTERCEGALSQDKPVPMVNVGDTVDFWVTAETMRRYLSAVMKPAGLTLRYRGDSKANVDRKYLAFEGDPQDLNFPPIGSPDARLTGLFIVVDATVATPVQHLSLLLDDYGAARAGTDADRIDDQTIVTLVTD